MHSLNRDLERIRAVADYQFGKSVGSELFPDTVEIVHSKRTGRIRHVYLYGERLATMRPTDGMFSLGIAGAKRIVENFCGAKCIVVVCEEASRFVAEGGDVFALHIVRADSEIRPKDEVIVVDECGKVLAVGRAVLSGGAMCSFRTGVAVKVRRGVLE